MKYMSLLFRVSLPAFVGFVIIVYLPITNAFGGNAKMEPLYDLNEVTMNIPPQINRIGASISYSLFSVPQDNAVGTNDHTECHHDYFFPKRENGNGESF